MKQDIDLKKRYWYFAYANYDENGGLNDVIHTSDEIEKFPEYYTKDNWYDNKEIFDSITREFIPCAE